MVCTHWNIMYWPPLGRLLVQRCRSDSELQKRFRGGKGPRPSGMPPAVSPSKQAEISTL